MYGFRNRYFLCALRVSTSVLFILFRKWIVGAWLSKYTCGVYAAAPERCHPELEVNADKATIHRCLTLSRKKLEVDMFVFVFVIASR